MQGFREATVRAVVWSAGGRFFSLVFSFFIGIALARMLKPDDFGLMAMILVVFGLAELFSDVGLGAALVQKQGLEDKHFCTVFWANLGLGFSFFVLLLFAADFMANFYGRLEIAQMSRVLSINFLLGSAALVFRQRLVKTLAFKVLASIDAAAMILSGVVAIFLAANGFGYWALVYQSILQRLIGTLLVWVLEDWRPSFIFDVDSLRSLTGFSGYVFGTGILQYVTNNLDAFVVGRFLGASSVGLLDKARSMMLFPLQNISHVIGSVMLPSLSMIQDDKARIKAVYMRSTQAIALFTFPMMVGMYVVAESFVLGVLGAQWLAAVPLLQVLCIAGVASSVLTITGALYLSQGASKLQFNVNLIMRPISIVGILVGLIWGVDGVVWGIAITVWINGAITLSFAGRLIGFSLTEFMSGFVSISAASLVMGAVIYFAGHAINIDSYLVRFLAQVAIGALSYLLAVFLLKPPAFIDLKSMLMTRLYVKWHAVPK